MLLWRQKVRLAFGIVLIYFPIRLYVNIAPLEPAMLLAQLPFLVAEVSLVFLFFWGWIDLLDRLLEWLKQSTQRFFTGTKPGETHLTTQFITLLVAVGLALVLNNGFGHLHRLMNEGITQEFPRLKPSEFRVESDTVPAGQREQAATGQRRRLNNGLTVLALLSAYYLIVSRRSAQEMQALRVRAEQLEKETAQARYSALRNQVNPHFLFNSLSILSSLVEVDPKLSVRFIGQLAKAYRYILEQRDNERVPLRTELDFIRAYTFLLRIRFDERLQVHTTLTDTDPNQFAIAPLTLQLLIENAVKHNQMSDENPLLVRIDRVGDYLRVANPLQLRPTQPAGNESTGVGLANIVSRYQLLSDRPVWFGQADGEFVVKIPLL